jgi:hypothetical protein
VQQKGLDEAARLSLITEAVGYCQRMAALGMPASCYAKALREPVYFLWEAWGRSKAEAAQFRSVAATGLRHGKGELVYDHAVPFAFLQAALLGLRPATPESVAQILRAHSTRVLITPAEHHRLAGLGLARGMPADWDGADPLARYKAAGIELVPNAPSNARAATL